MELDRNRATLTRSFMTELDLNDVEHHIRSCRAHSSDINARLARAQAAGVVPGDIKLQELTKLSLSPILRSIHNWWLQRSERHFLICADVELQRAREAQMNVAYYQKRAAMARSARN